MIYKYTSCKRIIAKVLTDLDLQEGNIRTTDFIEWMSEALLKIGSFPQFIIRTTGKEDLPLLQLNDYQVELPFDFYNLIQVSYGKEVFGPFYPMRYATGSFEYNPKDNVQTDSGVIDVTSTSSLVSTAMSLFKITYEEALNKINTEPDTRQMLNSMLTQRQDINNKLGNITDDYIYTIQGGFLKTNKQDGYIMLAYQAIPTDIEGYPLIPDKEEFIEALYWYITMKLYYPQWVSGKIRDAVYSEAKRSWNYYCKQAYGAALMPDRGQLESIKNAWVRLLPNFNEIDTDFSHLGQQQILYNHATNIRLPLR